MKNVPRFVYGPPGSVTLTLTFPSAPWNAFSETEGGWDQSASGAVESFLIRRDHLVEVTIRFFESEEDAVLAFLEWAQDNAGVAFTYAPDAIVSPGVTYSVYLEHPHTGEPVKPQRGRYAKLKELTLTLRRATAGRLTTAYYPA